MTANDHIKKVHTDVDILMYKLYVDSQAKYANSLHWLTRSFSLHIFMYKITAVKIICEFSHFRGFHDHDIEFFFCGFFGVLSRTQPTKTRKMRKSERHGTIMGPFLFCLTSNYPSFSSFEHRVYYTIRIQLVRQTTMCATMM